VGEIKQISDADLKRAEADLERVKRFESVVGDLDDVIARIAKRRFDAYVKEGFSEEQSLRIVLNSDDL